MDKNYTALERTGVKRQYRYDSLKANTLKFIREYCKNLNFDDNTDLKGKSLKSEIPFNMQMDIDRLCFERAIERFLLSGRKEDAFDVYFCYLDIFIKDYKKVRHMIELLSEYEANGSGLLMKHRDHYSHSVYVFCLGLSIYVSSSEYRAKYKNFYDLEDENKAAHHFLKYWGLSSMFHDIGYPFELPFEQVCSYFEVEGKERIDNPFMSYDALDKLIKLTDEEKKKLSNVLPSGDFKNTNEVFAYLIKLRLGEVYKIDEKQILGYLNDKPVHPDKFTCYMDHAYFSATVLFKRLFSDMDLELNRSYLDALTAILMHNSLYKFCIANPNMDTGNRADMHLNYKNKGNIPFRVELHPLAFMLMLCDELQCWDRIAYGRNSKLEFHPMHCRFFFSKDNLIEADYIFDIAGQAKIDSFNSKYKKWEEDIKAWKERNGSEKEKPKEPKLKAYSSMVVKKNIERTNGEKAVVSDFQADIESILDLSDIRLSVKCSTKERRKKNGSLSESNFMNLYDFAAALNARYEGNDELSQNEQFELFEKLSLEYKLSNINQAKSFAKYLTSINAFYTNKEVDFEKVTSFEPGELGVMGPMEHHRWLEEHYDMGWSYISKSDLEDIVKKETGIEDTESDEFKKKFKDYRELKRLHWDMIPSYNLNQEAVTLEQSKSNYERIGLKEQDKDTKPMITMLRLLEEYEGLRIYRY